MTQKTSTQKSRTNLDHDDPTRPAQAAAEYLPLFPPPSDGRPAFIYAVEPSGVLRWYRHDGAGVGGDVRTFRPSHDVGRGWDDFKHLIPGGNDVLYGVDSNGLLRWYRHLAFNTGDGIDTPGSWLGGKEAGHGWNRFTKIFGAGDGLIYAVDPDGTLYWYRHLAVLTGDGTETPGAWLPSTEVGRGWSSYTHVFSTGQGVIYGVAADGKLHWYRHVGYRTGEGLDVPGSWQGPREVGHGWDEFVAVFSAGDGIIYGVRGDGDLVWYRHHGYLQGLGVDVPGAWEGRRIVGSGWSQFSRILALIPGEAGIR